MSRTSPDDSTSVVPYSQIFIVLVGVRTLTDVLTVATTSSGLALHWAGTMWNSRLVTGPSTNTFGSPTNTVGSSTVALYVPTTPSNRFHCTVLDLVAFWRYWRPSKWKEPEPSS